MPVDATPTPPRRTMAGGVSTRGQTVGTSRASVSFWCRTDGAALLPMRLAPVTSGLAAHGQTYPVPLLDYVLRPYEQAFLLRTALSGCEGGHNLNEAGPLRRSSRPLCASRSLWPVDRTELLALFFVRVHGAVGVCEDFGPQAVEATPGRTRS